MLATGPEVVVVVGGGADPGARFGPGDGGDLHGFGVHVEIGFAGPVRAGSTRLPLAHTVGAWLLDQAGYSGTRIGVAPGSLATVSAEFPGRVGILAMGDGSARRTPKAPGYLDAAAEPFDRLVATALASGDADTLAALDPAEGDRLLAAGTRTWKAVGTVVGGRRITARQHYDDAPFGVGYLVTDWQLA
jgi:hypothetical protein